MPQLGMARQHGWKCPWLAEINADEPISTAIVDP
jgi:hypothetical protein